MSDIFARTRILLGTQGLETLRRAHVALFGVGGVGGYAAEALIRAGIGRLTVVDNDTVAPSNLNRQIIALHSTLGREKTAVIRERLTDINPQAEITARQCFLDGDTVAAFSFADYDYVIDAIDTVSGKLLLIDRCRLAGTPVVSCMGTANKLDPTRLKIGGIEETSSCPLARVMRRELRRRGIDALRVVYSDEPPAPRAEEGEPEGRRPAMGSVSFVPPVAGFYLASEVIRELLRRGHPSQKDPPPPPSVEP